MSVAPSTNEIEYPESDGKPVGETDVHIDWIFRIRDILRNRYRGQRVYVGSDMLVYYEDGNPRRFVVPDEFIVLDCEQYDRRTFKIWEEGRTPNVIIEVTSNRTKTKDQQTKPEIYRQLGIGEYFLYDPTAEYLNPALRGYRLQNGGYVPIEPSVDSWLACEQLGIELRLDARQLVMRDAATKQVLLTRADAEQAAREAAEAKQDAEQLARQAALATSRTEQAARQAAEAKVAELQAEVQRLRKELENRKT
jgi:Uma2 family endonuclease